MRTRLPLAAPVRYFESGLPKVPRPLQRIYAKSSIEVAECGRRFRHRGRSSNTIFPASEPLVPELTRSAGIQLNERVALRRQVALNVPA
jgi:hypothetical protein